MLPFRCKGVLPLSLRHLPCSRPPQPCLQLWLGSGGGNANFVYGMNLLWGGLQVLLLLRLLRGAARAEAKPAGGSEGAGAVAGGQQQAAAELAGDAGSKKAC